MGSSKRLVEPGIPIEKLPEIDIIVISHGHYDHLDFRTLRKIKGNPTIYLPIGLKKRFTWRGYKKVIEANWWESFSYEDLKITFVPAQHWTMRKIIDRNTSHWGGWVVERQNSEENVYFVGDTGYFRGFKEIGSCFNIGAVLMPIGAYEPEWFMKPSHINPEDGVKAFQELNAKMFIPMHYGTYHLADDTGPVALKRLNDEWSHLSLDSSKLKVLKIGETLIL
jgi:L-ascorbate metabolism protein UlaG (beta-lactamase superfamily)